MSDGMKVQKKSSYFCRRIIVFQCSLRMHRLIFNQNIAGEHFYSQANYEFMFIPSDTKNRKARGRFDGHGQKNRITFLGNSVYVHAK